MRIIHTVLCSVIAFPALAVADEAKTKSADLQTVEARSIELKLPAVWQKQKTTSNMRVAQYKIPGDPKAADFVVFYFGGPTGGIKSNVERWIGQFQKDGLELNMYQGKCTAGSYVLVDTKGTWNKPDGPPFARKTIAAPNSRVLNVIVIEEKDGEKDYYFIKLSGDQELVGKQTDVLRLAIGADAKAEKKFELKDAQ